MSAILVIQRNAHLAGTVRLDTVQGRDGPVPRATFVAISNERHVRNERHARNDRRGPEPRQDVPTAVRWTLWGRAAEHAARYLGKGSHVNVVGTVRADAYTAADGSAAHALVFTADAVDFLDTRSEAEERRERHAIADAMDAASGDNVDPRAAANPQPANA